MFVLLFRPCDDYFRKTTCTGLKCVKVVFITPDILVKISHVWKQNRNTSVSEISIAKPVMKILEKMTSFLSIQMNI